MSRKIRSNQVGTNTSNFNNILSSADNDVQKALNTLDDHIQTEILGGTGQTTYNTGDIIYSDGYNSLSKLPIGSNNYVLTSNGSTPEWRYFDDSNDAIDVIKVGKLDVITPNSTVYLLPDFSESPSEDFVSYIIDGYGVLNNLYVNAGTACGIGESTVFTVRVNGADTGLTTTLSGTSTSSFDVTGSANVVPGDLITVKAVTSASCAIADVYIGIRYGETVSIDDSDVVDIVTVGKIGIISPSFDGYLLPMFAQSTSEVFPAYIFPDDGYINDLRVYADTPPGLGEAAVITLRVNSVDTLLTATVSGTGNTAEDLINTVSVNNGNKATVSVVTSSGSAIANVFVVMKFSS